MNRIPFRQLIRSLVVPSVFVFLAGGPFLGAVPDRTLPDFVVRELTHLEETYRVLDITAGKVWSGWTNYRDLPFLLKYPNNLQVLVGHPNPPAPFEKISGLAVEDKEVYADFSQVNTASVAYPLMAGGGPLPFGTDKEGNPVMTVNMDFRSTDILKKGGYGVVPMPFCVELQILCYIHELFHCFQTDHVRTELVGNLLFNPDAPFALYSTLEGRALVNAYQASDPKESEACIRDFLAARTLKRKLSMPEMQQKQESMDDVMEGTAVYSEVRTLEILSEGYATKLDLSKDRLLFRIPERQGHPRRPSGTAEALRRRDLRRQGEMLRLRMLPGAPPPAIRSRLAGGLLQGALDPGRGAGQEVPGRRQGPVPLTSSGSGSSTDTMPSRPGATTPSERDDAYRALMGRRGTAYIISFKEIGPTKARLAPTPPPYGLGLIHMYMKGLPAVRLDETEISPISVPVEGNQLALLQGRGYGPEGGRSGLHGERASRGEFGL